MSKSKQVILWLLRLCRETRRTANFFHRDIPFIHSLLLFIHFLFLFISCSFFLFFIFLFVLSLFYFFLHFYFFFLFFFLLIKLIYIAHYPYMLKYNTYTRQHSYIRCAIFFIIFTEILLFVCKVLMSNFIRNLCH